LQATKLFMCDFVHRTASVSNCRSVAKKLERWRESVRLKTQLGSGRASREERRSPLIKFGLGL
jgi:hypothetical protein